MVRWNPQILEKHVAPGISTFTTATIPDISGRFPEATHWLSNYFLNAVLRVGWPDEMRQIVIGFLRRMSHAYATYHDARRMTLEYLDGNDPHNPRVSRYYHAISMWEVFVIDVNIAIDHFRGINNGIGAFTQGDGSKDQRLYDLANRVKHFRGDVESGKCSVNDTVPLWINGSGLNSFDITVTYNEAAEVLTSACELADDLQDPLSFIEKSKTVSAAGDGTA